MGKWIYSLFYSLFFFIIYFVRNYESKRDDSFFCVDSSEWKNELESIMNNSLGSGNFGFIKGNGYDAVKVATFDIYSLHFANRELSAMIGIDDLNIVHSYP